MIRRRSTIKPAIGNMKMDGRLGRNPLKGALGDALPAAMCGAGDNQRLILTALRLYRAHMELCLSALLSALVHRTAAVSIVQGVLRMRLIRCGTARSGLKWDAKSRSIEIKKSSVKATVLTERFQDDSGFHCPYGALPCQLTVFQHVVLVPRSPSYTEDLHLWGTFKCSHQCTNPSNRATAFLARVLNEEPSRTAKSYIALVKPKQDAAACRSPARDSHSIRTSFQPDSSCRGLGTRLASGVEF